MTSLKKYLEQEKDDRVSWFARIALLLLEGIALHAVEHDPEEYGEFRRQIRETIESFELAKEGRENLVIAAGAVKSLQIYNQSIEKFIRNVNAEKQAIIGSTTAAFLKISHASELSGNNLRTLEKELARACQLQDVRLLKSKINDCLETICHEAARAEERAQELKAPDKLATDLGPHDSVTGLPGSQHAEAHIKELIDAKNAAYVLVLLVKNLDNVNRRVGFAAGDQILALIGQMIGQRLSRLDQLFRWRGPCFVAALTRSETLDQISMEAAKIGSMSLEREIEGQGRSLFFKASMDWTLLALQNTPHASEIVTKIDAFATTQDLAKRAAR